MSLAYADDMVVLATKELDMQSILKRFEKYLKKKKLILNSEKSKIMIFRKGGGREKEEEWKWEDQEIEKVKEYKYLGYLFKSNGTSEAQAKQLARKGMLALPQVWSIGERKFGGEYNIRMLMYEALIKSIIMYGAEVWGWEEQDNLEAVQIKYLKWMLGVNRNTPTYIVLEETKMKKIKIEAAKKALKYEENIIRHPEKQILHECWKELERRDEQGKSLSRWETSRKKLYEYSGYSTKAVYLKRISGQGMVQEITDKMTSIQNQENEGKIRDSRYNHQYGKIGTLLRPQYLRGKGGRDKKDLLPDSDVGMKKTTTIFGNRKKRECAECVEKIKRPLNIF